MPYFLKCSTNQAFSHTEDSLGVPATEVELYY